jgi:probable rRNA maturation factor
MISVDVNFDDQAWKNEDKMIARNLKSLIKKIIPKTPIEFMIRKNIDIELSVVLSNDKKIKELNKKYRKKDKTTDVLSFPTLDSKLIKNGNLKNIDLAFNFVALGDIVLAIETIKKEAIEQNKKFKDHLVHLLIHGLLHLIGYDHEENEEDAKIMENLEIKLLKDFAIVNPYKISSFTNKS